MARTNNDNTRINYGNTHRGAKTQHEAFPVLKLYYNQADQAQSRWTPNEAIPVLKL